MCFCSSSSTFFSYLIVPKVGTVPNFARACDTVESIGRFSCANECTFAELMLLPNLKVLRSILIGAPVMNKVHFKIKCLEAANRRVN